MTKGWPNLLLMDEYLAHEFVFMLLIKTNRHVSTQRHRRNEYCLCQRWQIMGYMLLPTLVYGKSHSSHSRALPQRRILPCVF